MKPHRRFAKYIRGCGESLKLLAREIEQNEAFDGDSEALLKKISGELLYNAVAYRYQHDTPLAKSV